MDFHTIQRFIKVDHVDYFRSMPNPKEILSLHHEKSGDTVLHIACRWGSVNVLTYYIEELSAEIEACNSDGKRPLHEAAQHIQPECVHILLMRNAQIDPLKRADWTPLMLACTKDSLTIVNMLLKSGANPYLKNKDGWNSLHIAAREGHLPIIQSLWRNSPTVWNTRSHNLRSPLHTAALHGHKEVVLWMLQTCQYHINAADSCGVTPVMDALRAGHLETAQVLIHHKADVTLEDKAGRQSLHQVAQSGQIDSLEFLVEVAGVSVNTRSTTSNETALHTACKENQVLMVDTLLSMGSDINARDIKGRTALHIASGGQHREIVVLLLQRGAQLVTDESKQLPQDYARKTDILSAFSNVIE